MIRIFGRKFHVMDNPQYYLRSTVSKRPASYHIDHSDANKSTHEQAQANPLLGTNKKTFQHYFVGQDICDKTDCKDKPCQTHCGPIKEKVYVAHGTHDKMNKIPGAIVIGSQDFNGNPILQKAQIYDQPVPNHDTHGNNVDQKKTAVLKKDKHMYQKIHDNSSKKVPLEENPGSTNVENIN